MNAVFIVDRLKPEDKKELIDTEKDTRDPAS